MNIKIRFSFFLLFMCFSIILARAFYIQVINRDKLISYAESQFLRTKKIYPQRGNIYDRNGNPLAINVRNFNLAMIPKNNRDFVKKLRKLKKIIKGLNTKKIYKKNKGRNRFTWILRDYKLTDEQLMKIKKHKSFILEETYGRYYPNHELMSQLIGFVGIDNNGLGGIEYFFNKELKGEPKLIKYFRDAKGRALKYQSFANDEKKSYHITLSLDKKIQAVLEESLKEAVDHFQADLAGAGVMDASTGEILAMANYPTFDPNRYTKYNLKSRKLSFVTDPFEPGSTLKTFTIISGFKHNLINEDSNYYCEKGRFKVQNHIISEADTNKLHEWLSVSDILKYSSNIGVTKIAFDIGAPRLLDTLQEFGFGEKTNIEYPGESRGIFPKDDKLKLLRLSNISFGHGIATTGIQMLSAYAAILNDGKFVAPTFIKMPEGEKVKGKQLMDKTLAKNIKKILLKAVEEGTGGKAKIQHFKIAGKTSTAQRVNEFGGYKGYVSGFVGFPLDTNRKFVVYAYVDNPRQNGYYGNLVAAPIVNKIMKFILYKDKEIKSELVDKNQTILIDNVKIKKSARIKGNILPKLTGFDRRTVKNILKSYNIEAKFIGNGLIYKQHPAEGTPMDEIEQVKLYLKKPINDF